MPSLVGNCGLFVPVLMGPPDCCTGSRETQLCCNYVYECLLEV
jgi:hypothetical protein